MFDIGFFELLIIGIVGLFVIGPERLPETIKSVSIWVSRVKRNLLSTRQELEQHIGADEIRREIYNEQVLHNLSKMKDTKAELEQRINQWKDETVKEDAYLEHEPDEADTHPEHDQNNNSASNEESTTASSANKPTQEPQVSPPSQST